MWILMGGKTCPCRPKGDTHMPLSNWPGFIATTGGTNPSNIKPEGFLRMLWHAVAFDLTLQAIKVGQPLQVNTLSS